MPWEILSTNNVDNSKSASDRLSLAAFEEAGGGGDNFRLPSRGGDGAPPAAPGVEKLPGQPPSQPPRFELMPAIPPAGGLSPDLLPAMPPPADLGRQQALPEPLNIAIAQGEKNMRTSMASDFLSTAAISGAITEGGKHIYKSVFALPELTMSLPQQFAPLASAATTEVAATAGAAVNKSGLGAILESQFVTKTASGAGKGLLIGSASLATGYCLDRLLGTDVQSSGIAKLAVDGLLVPAALMSPMPMQYKIITSAALMGAVRVADYFNADRTQHNDLADPIIQSALKDPSSSAVGRAFDKWDMNTRRGQARIDMSSLLVPNGLDAMLMPAAVLGLPAQYKLAGMAGVFVAGRLYNAFAQQFHPNYGDTYSLPKK